MQPTLSLVNSLFEHSQILVIPIYKKKEAVSKHTRQLLFFGPTHKRINLQTRELLAAIGAVVS